ncbi:toll-like receptor 1 [Mercenaria mercenaria]|uniref:toll-like receptor 1 n=1 Tax=Mercenaria mercenaria TaxID=6596 RepID=UPI00234E99EC|nr:toll-like receptor 1 [Mercenaria mercenaria]XP_053400893.1 toll-like receptor 1 [Mercenaria mercenaria]
MTRTGTNMIFGMYTYIVIVTCLSITCVCLLEDEKCTFESDMLTCDNMVPPTVPPGVTEVYITIDSYTVYFEDEMFADKSWETVSVLDIYAQSYERKPNFHVRFQDGCFKSLPKLTELRFHGDRISFFDAEALASNDHLKVLEFSSCPLMEFDYFLKSLLRVNITIDKLTLSHISSGSGDYCKIDDQFIQMIARCGVSNLNLSNSNVIVQSIPDLPKRPNPLRSLDLSKVYFSHLGMNNDMRSIYETYDYLTDGLISLNVSEFPLERYIQPKPLDSKDITHCAQLNYKNIKFLFKIENVYADAIFKSNTVIIDNIFINISTCSVKLKTFQFRRNRVKYVNMTLYLPTQNNVTKFDISFNEIIYFSPYAFKTATSLLTLNLDNNKLGQMENLPEFGELLHDLASLKYFSIAGNRISSLPYDFFRGNSYLQVVDLSENIFETITFKVTNMHYLLVLNLSFNRIHFLEGKSLENVQIYLTRYDKNKVILDFSGNPIECSCKSVNFIEWILSDLQPHLKHRYTCDMEGKTTEIDDHSLQKSKYYLCYRTCIIVAGSICAFFILHLCASGCVLLIVTKKMRREKNAQELFLKNFLKRRLKEQYLCQISYASEDEICVLDTINPNLKRALNKHVAIERDCICLGDTHFNLGRPIIEEILRCISKSCVMIYVISEYFCRSQWCQMELREAYEINKPIILILKGEVPENEMPDLLSTIFNRYTRAKLVIEDGQYKLIPDWKSLCESIIKLAANSYVDKLNNEKRKNNNKQEDITIV